MKRKQHLWVSVLIVLLLLLAAFVVTLLTEVIPVGGHPHISVYTGIVCDTNSGYVSPPAPTHSLGLPIPFVTHFINTGCGYTAQINGLVFGIDYLVWVIALLIIWWAIRSITAARDGNIA